MAESQLRKKEAELSKVREESALQLERELDDGWGGGGFFSFCWLGEVEGVQNTAFPSWHTRAA